MKGGFWRQKALERDGMITGPGMADKAKQNTADTASITAARGLFAAYGEAITRLDGALGTPFSAAVDLVMKAGGHVVVCGMGKSGLDRKSTRLNSSHSQQSRMPSSA